jgi:hypothetical protein
MEGQSTSILNFYKKLIHTRNSLPALQYGTYHEILATDNAIMSFVRKHNNQVVLVLTNTVSNEYANVELTLPTDVFTESSYVVKDALDNNKEYTITVSNGKTSGIDLGQYQTKVLVFEPTAEINFPTSTLPTVTEPKHGNIFPNPVLNKIELHLYTWSKPVPFSILDASSKTVFEGILTKPKDTFDVSFLSNGVYYWCIEGEPSIRFVKE